MCASFSPFFFFFFDGVKTFHIRTFHFFINFFFFNMCSLHYILSLFINIRGFFVFCFCFVFFVSRHSVLLAAMPLTLTFIRHDRLVQCERKPVTITEGLEEAEKLWAVFRPSYTSSGSARQIRAVIPTK